jgi:chromosomal replication initiation ATPase DnaA
MTELTRQCLALSYDNRVRLIKVLQGSLRDNEIARKRFDTLLLIATEVMGNGILLKSRDRNFVIGRRMIAYQMRKEGYSSPLIGRLLGKNHTSVLYMESMMEDAIKFQFRPELTYWEEFKQKLQEYEEKISSKVV